MQGRDKCASLHARKQCLRVLAEELTDALFINAYNESKRFLLTTPFR